MFKIQNGVLKEYYGRESQVIIPEGVDRIDDYAFQLEEELVQVVMPVSLKTIGFHAFMGCGNLKQVCLNEGLVRIEDGAFKQCRSLEHVMIPRTIEYLGEEAFAGCFRLETADLSGCAGVQVKDSCFENCPGLKKVLLPLDLSGISGNLFWGEEDMANQMPLGPVRASIRIGAAEMDEYSDTFEWMLSRSHPKLLEKQLHCMRSRVSEQGYNLFEADHAEVDSLWETYRNERDKTCQALLRVLYAGDGHISQVQADRYLSWLEAQPLDALGRALEWSGILPETAWKINGDVLRRHIEFVRQIHGYGQVEEIPPFTFLWSYSQCPAEEMVGAVERGNIQFYSDCGFLEEEYAEELVLYSRYDGNLFWDMIEAEGIRIWVKLF